MSLFNRALTWLHRPRPTRTLIKASVVAVVVGTALSVVALSSYPQPVQANSLAIIAKPKTVVPTPVTVAPANAPLCAPAATKTITAPDLSTSQPGVTLNILPDSTYSVYGNSADTISEQMNRCTPSANNNDRYAASTDYAINWSFTYQNDGDGMCTIKSARVGLTILQTYPTWQPSAVSSANLQSSWQAFITNLRTHENGHSNLDQSGANTLLTHLQNLPATDCASIEAAANAVANNDISAIDQANDAYDNITNHGVTQGAVLR